MGSASTIRRAVLSAIFVGVAALAGCGASAAPATAPAGVAVDHTFGGSTSVGDPIVIQLDPRRGTVIRIAAIWDAPCVNHPDLITHYDLGPIDFKPSLSISASGRFAFTGQARTDLGTQVAMATLKVRGTVRGRTISGLISLSGDIVESQTQQAVSHCRVSKRFKAVSAPNTIYGGVTSQNFPVVIQRVPSSAKLGLFRIGWLPNCANGGPVYRAYAFHGLPPIKAGKFAANFNYASGGLTGSLRGRILGAMASGTYRDRSKFFGPSGAVAGTCDSGPVSWKATSG